MTYDQYAEESANPPPGLCSVCGKLKDDGYVDERGKWVCFDCDAKETT